MASIKLTHLTVISFSVPLIIFKAVIINFRDINGQFTISKYNQGIIKILKILVRLYTFPSLFFHNLDSIPLHSTVKEVNFEYIQR